MHDGSNWPMASLHIDGLASPIILDFTDVRSLHGHVNQHEAGITRWLKRIAQRIGHAKRAKGECPSLTLEALDSPSCWPYEARYKRGFPPYAAIFVTLSSLIPIHSLPRSKATTAYLFLQGSLATLTSIMAENGSLNSAVNGNGATPIENGNGLASAPIENGNGLASVPAENGNDVAAPPAESESVHVTAPVENGNGHVTAPVENGNGHATTPAISTVHGPLGLGSASLHGKVALVTGSGQSKPLFCSPALI